jgi:hypothetical protein
MLLRLDFNMDGKRHVYHQTFKTPFYFVQYFYEGSAKGKNTA